MTDLQRHILSTYIGTRYGMAIIAFAFPVIVYSVGWVEGVDLKGSLSAYYWAEGTSGNYLARVWFVGGLFVLATLLYLYKGFTPRENIALNFGGLFALGVALIPTDKIPNPDGPLVTPHGFCAVSAFLCLAYVVWFHARDTLAALPEKDRERLRRIYTIVYGAIGLLMLASPLTAWVLSENFGPESYIFFIESAGIWAFALYWLVKSRELKRSGATVRAIYGEITCSAPRKPAAAATDAVATRPPMSF